MTNSDCWSWIEASQRLLNDCVDTLWILASITYIESTFEGSFNIQYEQECLWTYPLTHSLDVLLRCLTLIYWRHLVQSKALKKPSFIINVVISETSTLQSTNCSLFLLSYFCVKGAFLCLTNRWQVKQLEARLIYSTWRQFKVELGDITSNQYND